MALMNRRVVTGLDAEGRSCVVFDGPPPLQKSSPDRPGYASALLWETDTAPARNDGAGDAGAKSFSYRLAPGGSAFLMFRQPGQADLAGLSDQQREHAMHGGLPKEYRERAGSARPGMHATPTVDYVVVVEGEVTLLLETEEVTLKAGDVVVDRGVAHAWENRGQTGALMVTVMLDAHPLQSEPLAPATTVQGRGGPDAQTARPAMANGPAKAGDGDQTCRTRNRDVVAAFCAAWNSRQVERLMDFIHPDAVYHNIPRPPLRGRATIGEAFTALAESARAIEFEITHIAETEQGVVLTERIDRITYGVGRADVVTMGVFELRDGQIVHWRDYYDEAQVAAAFAAARGDGDT